MTPYEHQVLKRLACGGELVDAPASIKVGYVFLRETPHDPIGQWELVPRATWYNLAEQCFIAGKRAMWHFRLNTEATIYYITRAGESAL